MKSPMQQALKVWRVNKPDDAPADDFDALAAHMWNAAIEAAAKTIEAGNMDSEMRGYASYFATAVRALVETDGK